MSTRVAPPTLRGRSGFGVHIVLKSGLRNLLMTPFAVMQRGPEAGQGDV